MLQEVVRARLDPLGERQVLAALKLRTRVSLSVLGDAPKHLRGEARRAAGGAPRWISQLILSDFGEPKPILANAVTAFRHAPEGQGVLAYDLFHGRTVLRGAARRVRRGSSNPRNSTRSAGRRCPASRRS